MLGTSRVVATILASVLVLAPVTALAQPPGTPAQKQQFGDMMKQAIAKSQAGDHTGAIEIYQKAYALIPLPTVLSNIGAEYQLATKPVEALKYFCMYLEKDPAGPLASYATGQAKLLQGQLTNTAVDDASVCKAPAPVPPPPPPNETTGTQDLTSPVSKATPDPGKTLKTVGMVAGGVGVITLGFGAYFSYRAAKISNDITDHKMDRWQDSIVAYQDEGQRAEYLQITCLTVGGLLVAGGVYLFVKGRSKTAESTTITPSVSPGGGGMVLSGSF
jgi:tetratricopeptide (TPR) repeat protein